MQGDTSNPAETTAVEAGIPDFFTVRLDWRRWWTMIPEIVAFSCMIVLPAVLTANVIARYTNWFHVLWSGDVSKVLFLWVVFLGGALAVKYDAHIKMTMLSDRLTGGGRAGRLWAHCIALSPALVGAILLVLGVRVVEISMHRELPMLHVTVGYFMTVIPASGALIIWYTLASFLRRRKPQAASPSIDAE